MPRNMDKHRDKIAELERLRMDMTKIAAETNRQLAPLKKREEQLNAELVKAMRGSTDAEVDGQPAFYVADVSKLTATKERVLKYAPHVADLILQRKPNLKVKFY